MSEIEVPHRPSPAVIRLVRHNVIRARRNFEDRKQSRQQAADALSVAEVRVTEALVELEAYREVARCARVAVDESGEDEVWGT